MRIDALVSRWMQFRPIGTLIDAGQVLGCCIRAAEMYASHAGLKAQNWTFGDFLDGSTDLTVSEWGLIEPLFMLYVEREEALYIDATKQFGGDMERRSGSEVAQDIERYLETLPRKSFLEPVLTLQLPEPTYPDRFGFLKQP